MGRASAPLLVVLGFAAACSTLYGEDEPLPTASPSPEAGVADSGAVVVEPGPDGGLPASCNDREVACTGPGLTIAGTCTGGQWQLTPCEMGCKDGRCLTFPSCAKSPSLRCGKDGVSCCSTAPVPGGTYTRGVGGGSATISPFKLDLYEVTLGRFRAFMADGGATKTRAPADGAGAHPKNPESGWHSSWNASLPNDVTGIRNLISGGNSTWTQNAGANEDRPINRVPWLLAFAFCVWDGGRLPTSAEWGFAAAGGAEQRVYPWSVPATSTTITGAQAIYDCSYVAPAQTCGDTCNDGTACDGNCAVGCTSSCSGCTQVDIAPVGKAPGGSGAFGHLDLVGSLGEWTLDLGAPAPLISPCNDCAQFLKEELGRAGAGSWGGAGGKRASFIVVGGAWNDLPTAVKSSSSVVVSYDERRDTIGFRCARD